MKGSFPSYFLSFKVSRAERIDTCQRNVLAGQLYPPKKDVWTGEAVWAAKRAEIERTCKFDSHDIASLVCSWCNYTVDAVSKLECFKNSNTKKKKKEKKNSKLKQRQKQISEMPSPYIPNLMRHCGSIIEHVWFPCYFTIISGNVWFNFGKILKSRWQWSTRERSL